MVIFCFLIDYDKKSFLLNKFIIETAIWLKNINK